MQLVIACTIGVLAVLYLTLRYLDERHVPNEPPTVSSKLPILGHVIKFIKGKSEYCIELYLQSQLPIYSLNLGGQRVYVVNSPDLIKQVQKQPKIFAFSPLAAHFCRVTCQSSKEANDIVDTNINGEDGDTVFTKLFNRAPSLMPGSELDDMNRVMVENIACSVQNLVDPAKAGRKILLFKWLRHEIALATTNVVYGPLNPFKNRKVEEAFWELNDDLELLLINTFPPLTASRGHRARKIVIDAFLEYFQKNGQESASPLIKTRYQNSIDNNIQLQDIAKLEICGATAALISISPTAFWMLFYIFSRPELLQGCRKELDNIVTTSLLPDGTVHRVINITSIKTQYPLFNSIFAETLRVRSVALGGRKIMQDIIFDGKYLLKKDRTVMMPARVLHTDPEIWGNDVKEFNPDRFLKNSTKKHDPAAFRGFGGGTSLCPGRHLATMGILSIVTMFVLRYELEATHSWDAPHTSRTSAASGVMEPDTDVEVKLSLRPEYEDGEWVFEIKDSEMVFAIAAKDRVGLSSKS